MIQESWKCVLRPVDMWLLNFNLISTFELDIKNFIRWKVNSDDLTFIFEFCWWQETSVKCEVNISEVQHNWAFEAFITLTFVQTLIMFLFCLDLLIWFDTWKQVRFHTRFKYFWESEDHFKGPWHMIAGSPQKLRDKKF